MSLIASGFSILQRKTLSSPHIRRISSSRRKLKLTRDSPRNTSHFCREYFDIVEIKTHSLYTFISWYVLQLEWKMKRNQSHWMHCLAVSGKKEVFLARQSVSTCHVCRIHQSASHVSISRTPRGRGRTSGVECVSLSVHDTRNFFFTDIRAFPRAQWTIDHLCTTCAQLFSILISRIDPGQRTKVSVSKVKETL